MVAHDLSRPQLYGPAAVQAPTKIQMLNSTVKPALKDNSSVVSGFHLIKEVLNMARAQGKYFESLSEGNQEDVVNYIKNMVIPSDRMSRLTKKLLHLVKLDNQVLAYEEFLEFMFGATIVSGKIIKTDF